jgi:ABC-2 type transport system ATP-binding protein
LLLDEPTVGVDPQSRNAIFDTIEVLAGEGRALVYTTHYMEEVERLCDRIVIIDHGKVLADDTLTGLLASAAVTSKLTLKYDLPPDGAALAEIARLPGVTKVDLAGSELSVSATELGTAPREALAARNSPAAAPIWRMYSCL